MNGALRRPRRRIIFDSAVSGHKTTPRRLPMGCSNQIVSTRLDSVEMSRTLGKAGKTLTKTRESTGIVVECNDGWFCFLHSGSRRATDDVCLPTRLWLFLWSLQADVPLASSIIIHNVILVISPPGGGRDRGRWKWHPENGFSCWEY